MKGIFGKTLSVALLVSVACISAQPSFVEQKYAAQVAAQAIEKSDVAVVASTWRQWAGNGLGSAKNWMSENGKTAFGHVRSAANTAADKTVSGYNSYVTPAFGYVVSKAKTGYNGCTLENGKVVVNAVVAKAKAGYNGCTKENGKAALNHVRSVAKTVADKTVAGYNTYAVPAAHYVAAQAKAGYSACTLENGKAAFAKVSSAVKNNPKTAAAIAATPVVAFVGYKVIKNLRNKTAAQDVQPRAIGFLASNSGC